MPLIKMKHISSFSSEDSAQPSSNLLKPETYRKWRCAEPGEKQAVVVIELEKATNIHSIDIGNNGSALIEVLVGRSSDTSVDAFKVLLLTSSFMSPADSKSFTNTSRVRMFGHEKLSKPVADEKWDKVKIVCTQPFNKNERYGLSFVSLHSPPEDSPSKGSGSENPLTPKRLGSFTLKDEEEEYHDIKPGRLFFQKKKNSPSVSSTAAKVRDASFSSNKRAEVCGMAKSKQPVAVEHKAGRERKPEKQDLKPVEPDQPVLSNTRSIVAQSTNKKRHNNYKINAQKAASPPPKKAKKSSHSKQEISFHEIMKGVVFVLSGFKNPKRGEIRDQALEMGAQYKPDWTTGCTHLICAFSNTPKYYQVKGKGKIVTRRWISDCYRKRIKLPTRTYHLPGDTSSSYDSSDDEPENRLPLSSRHSTNTILGDIESKPSEAKKEIPEEVSTNIKNSPETSNVQRNDQVDPFDDETDDETAQKIEKEKMDGEDLDSDQDTEDELERIQEDKDDDIYNLTTEDEQDDKAIDNKHDESSDPDEFPELPDFFSKKHFLLYGEMDQSTRRKLIRYITAYDGTLEDYMTDSVDFVITCETWDQNFEDALSENASLAFIKPAWILACHEKSTMVPFQPYIITPS